jgi:predicted O-linked N-acetylglucosamine transferase (SPINDLY family)
MFEARGVTRDRVLFQWTQTREEYLRSLAELDVFLDTFPFNGATSTYEALWMGLPVITRTSNRMVGHFGESILEGLGCEGWVARSDEEFIEKATALVQDVPALAEIRRGLRQRFISSPLCDAPTFAREIEDAYERMIASRSQSESNAAA